MSKFDIAIVIVTYNSAQFIGTCIGSIHDNLKHLRYQIFVVDNGSKDETLRIVREAYSGVTLITNESNIGFSAANNIGIRSCDAKYVCLLNADTRVTEKSLNILYSFMEDNLNAGISGPMFLNNDSTFQRSIITFPTLWYEIKYHLTYNFYPFSKLFSGLLDYARVTAEQSKIETPTLVDAIPGACMFLRKAVLDEIGLLDEDYFLFSEENDLCFRARKHGGWDVIYVPSAKVMHYGGHSFDKSTELKKEYYFYLSRFRFVTKHRTKFVVLAWRVVHLFFFSWVRMVVHLRERLTRGKTATRIQTLNHLRSLSRIYLCNSKPS
jgi:hypothetical protein